MKQIGNLAIVCAMRDDVSLQLYDHRIAVHVGQGPQRAVMSAVWDDDQAIDKMIRELNFGAYSVQAQVKAESAGVEHMRMISPERQSELLDLLIDDLIEEEGDHAVPVLERLAQIGFTQDELIALRFPQKDVQALGESAVQNECV